MSAGRGKHRAAALVAAVEVNEAAKEVWARSFHVGILALDAIVKSQRATTEIRGFREVASQMRTWAASLREATDRLVVACERSVDGASRMLKQERVTTLLELTAQASGGAGALAPARLQASAGLASARREVVGQERELVGCVDELVQLGKMACVLSRSAMIEAAKADDELRQTVELVAREFYDNGEHVLQVVKGLRRRLEAR